MLLKRIVASTATLELLLWLLFRRISGLELAELEIRDTTGLLEFVIWTATLALLAFLHLLEVLFLVSSSLLFNGSLSLVQVPLLLLLYLFLRYVSLDAHILLLVLLVHNHLGGLLFKQLPLKVVRLTDSLILANLESEKVSLFSLLSQLLLSLLFHLGLLPAIGRLRPSEHLPHCGSYLFLMLLRLLIVAEGTILLLWMKDQRFESYDLLSIAHQLTLNLFVLGLN